eukprot:s178_g52.t1
MCQPVLACGVLVLILTSNVQRRVGLQVSDKLIVAPEMARIGLLNGLKDLATVCSGFHDRKLPACPWWLSTTSGVEGGFRFSSLANLGTGERVAQW